jgi:catechol 2,3-dioxygenase-like lactoylglutathione lyase family enzyme
MKIKEANVTINVENMDRSISFYESIGFILKNRWENYYAQLTAPGITIGLHPSRGTTIQTENVSIGFITADFSEAKAELERLDIKYNERKEQGGTFLHFNDPDGVALYVYDPTSK